MAEKIRKQKQIKVFGKHVYGNLYFCNKELLYDEKFLVEIVKEACKVANSTLSKIISYRFGNNGGVSVIAIVAESHISIHTWPEYGYATLDVYTCGKHTKPEEAFDFVVKKLKPKKFTKHFVDRSLIQI